VRVVEDVDEVVLSAAEAKALVAGDPDVLKRVQLQTDIHNTGVKFGGYPEDVVRKGALRETGLPITWAPSEVRAGRIEVARASGEAITLLWDDAARNPGFCKLDWVVADTTRQQIASVSNVLDVTWEAPDGTILSLDGGIDLNFQEVYLASGSLPVVVKLLQHVGDSATGQYVAVLEDEIRKYLREHLNYAKVAKRLYNIFRLTGRLEEAVYLRSVFNGSAAVLYRVWSVLETVEEATSAEVALPTEVLVAEIGELMSAAAEALPRRQVRAVLTHLRHVADCLTSNTLGSDFTTETEAARAALLLVINSAFHARLVALPSIRAYLRRFDCAEGRVGSEVSA
jgi:hypothetical protein